MSLKWIWLWFYLFNQTFFFFFPEKTAEVFFSQWALLKLVHLLPWELELETHQTHSSRKVSTTWWKHECKEGVCLANDCVLYILLCVLSPKDENLFQAPAGTLTSSAQTTKLQALGDGDFTWRKMGGIETACNSYGESWQVSQPFPFSFNGKDPTVISSWSPDCLSQCPPNAPSCQEACQVWKKEMSLGKGSIWTEAFLQLLFSPFITWALSTAFEESITSRHDGGSQRHMTNTCKGQVQHWTNSTSLQESWQRDGALLMTWSHHRQVTFKQLNPNSAFLGIKCLTGKGHCL